MQPMLIRNPLAQCISIPTRLPVCSTPTAGQEREATFAAAENPKVRNSTRPPGPTPEAWVKSG